MTARLHQIGTFGAACSTYLRRDACAVTHPSGSTHWSRRRDRVSEFAAVMMASGAP